MRHVRLYAYNRASEGASELCEALGIRKIKHENSTYRGGPGKIVINWGSSTLPENVRGSRIINPPTVVAQMSNKLRFFEAMEQTDCRTPEWTVNRQEAIRWCADGHKVCARAVLNGHSGNGLSIIDHNTLMPNVPLYTKYTKKKAEYRLHFVGDMIIDVQRKIKRPDFNGTPNWHIRNHDNGFIFVRNGVREALPADVILQVQHCVDNCGLDFGAIDVVFNENSGLAYTLEVNTAPGLSGETVRNYADAFRRMLV